MLERFSFLGWLSRLLRPPALEWEFRLLERPEIYGLGSLEVGFDKLKGDGGRYLICLLVSLFLSFLICSLQPEHWAPSILSLADRILSASMLTSRDGILSGSISVGWTLFDIATDTNNAKSVAICRAFILKDGKRVLEGKI